VRGLVFGPDLGVSTAAAGAGCRGSAPRVGAAGRAAGPRPGRNPAGGYAPAAPKIAGHSATASG